MSTTFCHLESHIIKRQASSSKREPSAKNYHAKKASNGNSKWQTLSALHVLTHTHTHPDTLMCSCRQERHRLRADIAAACCVNKSSSGSRRRRQEAGRQRGLRSSRGVAGGAARAAPLRWRCFCHMMLGTDHVGWQSKLALVGSFDSNRLQPAPMRCLVSHASRIDQRWLLLLQSYPGYDSQCVCITVIILSCRQLCLCVAVYSFSSSYLLPISDPTTWKGVSVNLIIKPAKPQNSSWQTRWVFAASCGQLQVPVAQCCISPTQCEL